jgi:GNAT superfamily N-acetyltransferase
MDTDARIGSQAAAANAAAMWASIARAAGGSLLREPAVTAVDSRRPRHRRAVAGYVADPSMVVDLLDAFYGDHPSDYMPSLRMWVGECDGAPVATSVAWTAADHVGVYWVAVRHSHRRSGFGAAMTAAAAAAVPGRPSVLVATPAGEALYTSLGYRRVAMSTRWVRVR